MSSVYQIAVLRCLSFGPFHAIYVGVMELEGGGEGEDGAPMTKRARLEEKDCGQEATSTGGGAEGGAEERPSPAPQTELLPKVTCH